MSYIGQQEVLPTYDTSINPSTFNIYNKAQLAELNTLILTILFNTSFIYNIIDITKQARTYYNQNPKQWCDTIKLTAIEGQTDTITLYLPSAINCCTLSPKPIDNNKKTDLMRILRINKLPTCWSNETNSSSPGNCISISQAIANLTYNEKLIYYYIKNADFFTRLLNILKTSISYHSDDKFFCKVMEFPSDIYGYNKKYLLTGDYLRYIFNYYLQRYRVGSSLKLPIPLSML